MTKRDDLALAALDRLIVAVERTEADLKLIRKRADFIRKQRAAGVPWTKLVAAEQQPLIVKLVGLIHERLNSAGVEWRRLEAAALHAEGMSMEDIATLFGVTRQRISTLLRNS